MTLIKGELYDTGAVVIHQVQIESELVLIFACLLAAPSWLALSLFLATFPLLAIRILAEENLLQTVDDYRVYSQQVRWRLIPLVW